MKSNTKQSNNHDDVLALLKKEFPHGHPKFVERCFRAMQLHDQKNQDYAKGGPALGNFIRVAKIIENYPGFPVDKPIGISLIYKLKQLDAIMWMLSNGYEGKIEGFLSRQGDVEVYGLIEGCMFMDEQEKKDQKL